MRHTRGGTDEEQRNELKRTGITSCVSNHRVEWWHALKRFRRVPRDLRVLPVGFACFGPSPQFPGKDTARCGTFCIAASRSGEKTKLLSIAARIRDTCGAGALSAELLASKHLLVHHTAALATARGTETENLPKKVAREAAASHRFPLPFAGQ